MPGAYEKLKEVTRGKSVTAEAPARADSQPGHPQADKERLLALTPASYIGMATELARRV